jgi:hypothetical protein
MNQEAGFITRPPASLHHGDRSTATYDGNWQSDSLKEGYALGSDLVDSEDISASTSSSSRSSGNQSREIGNPTHCCTLRCSVIGSEGV